MYIYKYEFIHSIYGFKCSINIHLHKHFYLSIYLSICHPFKHTYTYTHTHTCNNRFTTTVQAVTHSPCSLCEATIASSCSTRIRCHHVLVSRHHGGFRQRHQRRFAVMWRPCWSSCFSPAAGHWLESPSGAPAPADRAPVQSIVMNMLHLYTAHTLYKQLPLLFILLDSAIW